MIVFRVIQGVCALAVIAFYTAAVVATMTWKQLVHGKINLNE